MGSQSPDKGKCMNKRVAFIFPGQGAQFPGMGKEIFETFPRARELLEEAEDILKKPLKRLIFEGPEELLIKTSNSQVAIFVVSVAIWQVLASLVPAISPVATAGLSLGEYTAAVCAGVISYQEALPLVQLRAALMEEACVKYPGTMAVILGLSSEEVEKMVLEMKLPYDLWAANFNCPGQVVISGTHQGIAAATEAAKQRGAKRVLPLSVHGAFHSGLMADAQERLAPMIDSAVMEKPKCSFAMNVPGGFVESCDLIRSNLKKQVTSPVRWEQGIREIEKKGIDFYFEIGPGTTLAGMNKKIGISGSTLNFQTCDAFEALQEVAK